MKILITGNLGYVGSVLVRHLRTKFPTAYLVGFDSGYFANCLTTNSVLPEIYLDKQIFSDIRKINVSFLQGFDAVIQLAAISNDPMGNKFEEVTNSINYVATKQLIDNLSLAGVSRFIFASSCSIYGAAEGNPRNENDNLNPLTAYARSKVAIEEAMKVHTDDKLISTALRFSTACGMSPRLRLDLVLNDFVASAIATGEINVMSDGSPWRPLIDVKDMAKAIEWALIRKPEDSSDRIHINVGSDDRNFQVKELAEAVKTRIPGTNVSINQNAQPDKRSYKVDFSLYKKLAPEFQPETTVFDSIDQISSGLREMGFKDKNFRNSKLTRLHLLEELISQDRLSNDLTWN